MPGAPFLRSKGGAFVSPNGHHTHYLLVSLKNKKAGRLDPAFNLENLVAGVGFEPTTFGL